MIKLEKKADEKMGWDGVSCTNTQVVDAKEKSSGLQGTCEGLKTKNSC